MKHVGKNTENAAPVIDDQFALTDGATVTIDMSKAAAFSVTLGGNRTITATNLVAGSRCLLIIQQDSTGGRTVTWDTSVFKWTGNTPALQAAASGYDVFELLCLSSTTAIILPYLPIISAPVAAPTSVTGILQAIPGGSNCVVEWQINVTTGPASGAVAYYGYQTSTDGSTWGTEQFCEDSFFSPVFSSGNQYARVRAYPMTLSGTSPSPSAWVVSAAVAYVAPASGSPTTIVTLTDAASVAPNCASGSNTQFSLVATNAVGNTRMLANPTGSPIDGQEITIRFTQDTFGSRLLSFDSQYQNTSAIVFDPTAAASTQLVTDGGFESSTGSWTITAGSFERFTASKHSGSYSLACLSNAYSKAVAASPSYNLTSGSTSTLSFWWGEGETLVASEGGVDYTFARTSDGVAMYTWTVFGTGTSNWHQIVQDVSGLPSGTYQLRVTPHNKTFGKMGGYYTLVDDVSLTSGGAYGNPTFMKFKFNALRTEWDLVETWTSLTSAGQGQNVQHLVGVTSTPAIAAGTGAGTSPTIAIVGSDTAGKITLTTGTTPTAAATIFTVTFSKLFATAPYPDIVPANAAAAALNSTTSPYVDAASTTTALFVAKANSAALAASTQYIWYYSVTG